MESNHDHDQLPESRGGIDQVLNIDEDADPFAVTPFDQWVQRLHKQHDGIHHTSREDDAGTITVHGNNRNTGHVLTEAMTEKFLRNGYVPVESGHREVRLRRIDR
jgi:hypothetical protein